MPGEADLKSNLKAYWNIRAPNYNIYDAFGRKILKAHLDRLEPQPKSLVECGCGRGALFPLFEKIPRVLGLDFSEGMLEYAHRRKERHEYKNIEIRLFDLGEDLWDSREEKFDVALTRTVLMHIPPEKIKRAAENLTLMSDTVLVFEYYSNLPSKNLAFHNWNHNYIEIFKLFDYKCIEAYQRPDMQQTLFKFMREENGRENRNPS